MRILVIKMSSMGDVVHMLPAVTDLAAQGDEIHWVVEEAFVPIVRAHPSVTRVIPIAWRRWRQALSQLVTPRARAAWSELKAFKEAVRSTQYDIVIDAQGLYKSAIVTRWADAPVKVGFDRETVRERGASRFYTEGAPVAVDQHAVDRLRSLCALAAGYTVPQPPRFGIERTSDPNRAPVALLLHGTSWPSKEYPEAHWIALGRTAQAQGYRIVMTWGDDVERQRAERIAAGIRASGETHAEAATLWDRMALDALIQRLNEVSVVIGVDSGIGHLAAALGIPSIGLFGASDAQRTGLRGRYARDLSPDFACAPCLSRVCRYQGEPVRIDGVAARPACLAGLTSAAVWQAAEALLAQRRRQLNGAAVGSP
ncbi:MAG: lipopolysaccharide heptosyltransferase I [Pseudomonadota bacterium]